jgi:hypothetical protein
MKTLLTVILLASLSYLLAGGAKDTPYTTVTAAGVTLNYRVTDDMQHLDCQLSATTTGWVAVGFAPTSGMANANFIIGYHSGGNTFIRDDWGTSASSHASDVTLGGTNNIITSSSTETGGVTQLNFIIPLDSGDSFDRILAIGQTYNIILGRGINGGDSFTASHSSVGSGSITLTMPVSNDDSVIPQPDDKISLNLSPNPFSSILNITAQSKDGRNLSLSIFDARGREITKWNAASGTQNTWDGSGYPAGVYYIRAADSEGSTLQKVLRLK